MGLVGFLSINKTDDKRLWEGGVEGLAHGRCFEQALR